MRALYTNAFSAPLLPSKTPANGSYMMINHCQLSSLRRELLGWEEKKGRRVAEGRKGAGGGGRLGVVVVEGEGVTDRLSVFRLPTVHHSLVLGFYPGSIFCLGLLESILTQHCTSTFWSPP